MKLEKFQHGALLFFTLLSLLACNTEEPDDPIVNKPQPVDSKPITLEIDKALDFKNFRVHTLLDSANLDNPKEKLYGPSLSSSPLIFTDNTTGEVMAIAFLDSTQSQVVINAETVTKAFLELLPAYNALSDQNRSKFLADSKSVKAYTDLLSSIGNLLKSRESVYSTKADHLSASVALNEHLVKTYLQNPALPGGKLEKNQENFSEWVTSANGASIVNRVRSFVHVEFTPIGQGSKIGKLLDPRSFYSAPSPIRVSELSVPDNCYNVKFSQERSEAKTANTYAIAKGSVELVFDALFGKLGNKKNDCVAKIAGSLTSNVTKLVLESAGSNDRVSVVAMGMLEATKSAFGLFTDTSCAKFLFSKKIITKVIAKNAVFIGKLFEGIGTVKSGAEMVPYILALIDGVELEQVLQLYEGRLVEACVQVVKGVNLESTYPEGEKLTVRIKLEPQSEYATWKKSGFKVSWKLPPNNGELSLASFETSSDGTATVNWTLPKIPNAVVTLTAELKDKEGDQLKGSPLNFQVKVESNTITDPRDGNVYKIVKIGNQTWFAENLRYAGNVAKVSSKQTWADIWIQGTSLPAWANYNFNSQNDAVFGKYYNFYAVERGSLCPPGWRIPTVGDWTVLTGFLGGDAVSGGKMKSVTGWNDPNTGATNESGFTGLSGGFLGNNGDFIYQGDFGGWWSSTTDGNLHAWYWYMTSTSGMAIRANYLRPAGFSCRCIKE